MVLDCSRYTPDPTRGRGLAWQEWAPTPPPTPPPDPADLARKLIASITFHPIEMGTDALLNPPSTQHYSALVGSHLWLWVENPTPNTWGPLHDSITDTGVTVTVEGTAQHVEWDLGNGDTLQCGTGTKAPPNRPIDQPSPTCSYQYPNPGIYTLTATTHWHIQWTGAGETGTLETHTTTTATLHIAETHTLTTNNP